MIEQLQEEIAEQLAEAEDEVIKHRIDYMLNKDNFISRFLNLSYTLSKQCDKSADNRKQMIADFLMDEMDVNG